MPSDAIVIFAAVIGSVILIELIIVIVLYIRCSKQNKTNFCKYWSFKNFCKRKSHTYNVRQTSKAKSLNLSTSSDASSTTNSTSERLDSDTTNKSNEILANNVNNNYKPKIFVIDTVNTVNECHNDTSKLTKDHVDNNNWSYGKKSNKSRMNSYLYAINYKHLIHEIEKDNFLKNFLTNPSPSQNQNKLPPIETPLTTTSVELNTQNSLDESLNNSFTELNSESSITTTDNRIPSPPSPLNLIPITNFPTSPTPPPVMQHEYNFDFESLESDDTNQFKKLFSVNSITINNNTSENIYNDLHQRNQQHQQQSDKLHQLPISSVNFIRTYLEKYNTPNIMNTAITRRPQHDTRGNGHDVTTFNVNKNILVSTSTLSNETMHDLDTYLNQLSTEEIIETTIEFINKTSSLNRNFK